MTETIFTVKENTPLTKRCFRLELKADVFERPRPGQFVSLAVPDGGGLLLRRPFAVAAFDESKKNLSICVNIAGKGTEALSKLREGDTLSGLYPLGNGFLLKENEKTVILLGGGAGIFPLFSVCRHTEGKKFHTLLGFKNAESVMLEDEFKQFSKELLLTTEDGSAGASGYVTDSLKRNLGRIKPDVILACGPPAMLRALKAALRDYPGIPAYVSPDDRMGCGLGACLVCVCDTNSGHRRVCKDGPVFDINEVVF